MAKTSIYGQLLQAQIRSAFSYRTSFVLECVSEASTQVRIVVPILVVFSQVNSLGGFSKHEALLMYALVNFAFGLAHAIVSKLDELPEHLRMGKLDILLVRPLNPLGQLLTAEFQPRSFGRILASFTIYSYTLFNIDIPWTINTVVLILLTLLSGIVIISSLWVITSAIAFWTIGANNAADITTYGLETATLYPITIYPSWIRTILCFIVPGAFIAYYPALAILNKPDPLGGSVFLGWLTPGIALLAITAAGIVWRLGIRSYQGTGS